MVGISSRTLQQEPQSKLNLDLSDLPPTRYTLPPGFVDELLDDLQKMNVAHRYPLPPNFMDEFLSNLEKIAVTHQ